MPEGKDRGHPDLDVSQQEIRGRRVDGLGAKPLKGTGMSLGLFTDLYELAMLRAYWELGHDDEAVFSLFIRRLPPARNFLVACGVGDLLDQLESLRFDKADLAYLSTRGFPDSFLDRLAGFRFTGDVNALPEGTPFFANEPILEVIAPISEAQLIETLILNQVGFGTLIASKAARIVAAAQGRTVIDFGGRRAHGIDAAIKGARAAYVAGAAATSNVEAGRVYGIPIAGTMAHSFVESFANEAEAFCAFIRVHPETVLLVDTYDTVAGVKRVIALARELGDRGKVRAVRLDSGDLAKLSKEARKLLDEAGLRHIGILASGGLNEAEIEALLAAGAPIDSFGVGTDLVVSTDAPAFDIAYKLTEYAGEGRMKFSTGKRTLPGRKQVFRRFENGVAQGDIIARGGETLAGSALLVPAMKAGMRLASEPLEKVRARCMAEVARLPAPLRALEHADPPYPVEVSPALADFERETFERVSSQVAEAPVQGEG